MVNARPIYKKLLIAAIAIYIIGMTVLLADIYIQIGEMRHALMHAGVYIGCDHK